MTIPSDSFEEAVADLAEALHANCNAALTAREATLQLVARLADQIERESQMQGQYAKMRKSIAVRIRCALMDVTDEAELGAQRELRGAVMSAYAMCNSSLVLHRADCQFIQKARSVAGDPEYSRATGAPLEYRRRHAPHPPLTLTQDEAERHDGPRCGVCVP